jgi:protein TonB
VAFESYRTQKRGPSLAKRVVFVVVALAHGAAIAAGVVYSYWHVDELTPPTLRVTFISAAPPPPPPPPPPPAGGGGKPKKVAIKTTPVTPVVVPKPTDIVQPREKPAPTPVKKEFRKHDDEEEDEDEDAPKGGVKGGIKGGVIGGVEGGEVGGELGGVKGGVKGGVIGGEPGGAGPALAKKFLAPNMGKLQWDGCAEPAFPLSLRKVGVSYNTTVKICVSKAGVVESVLVLKHSDSVLDANVVSAMKACKHKPLMANSIAVPFCYIQPFEFQTNR